MEEVGFTREKGASEAFWHEERSVACVVHRNDFIFSGADKDLTWVEQLMKEWFEVKVRARIGPDESDDKENSIWGKRVRWEQWGISYQANPKHRAIVLERIGLGDGSRAWRRTGSRRSRTRTMKSCRERRCGGK